MSPRRRNPLQHEGDERPRKAPAVQVVPFRTRKAAAEHARELGGYVSHTDNIYGWTGKRSYVAIVPVKKKNPPRRRAAKKRTRTTRRNPSDWGGHASVRGGELFSRRVLRVEYEHEEDPAGVARTHDFGPGVFMYAMRDGTVLFRHRDHPRKRVWADLPDRSR